MSATTLTTRTAYTEAVAAALAAAAAYYNRDDIVMDDATYDQLVRDIAATEDARPEWVVDNGLTTQVAAGTSTGDIAHSAPMLSLDNVYNDEELALWATSLDRRLDKTVVGYTVEPKGDGLAGACRWKNGELVLLLNRGSGTEGDDVTYAAASIVGLPAKLSEPLDIEVRGEILFTDAQFAYANEQRIAHGELPFVNPRNGASGTLRGAKNRAYTMPLTFFAYGVVDLGSPLGGQKINEMSHSAAMREVAKLGVSTLGTSSAGMGVFDTIAEVHTWVADLVARRSTLGFEIDGAVIKADLAADRIRAGSGSKSPHWARAQKFPANGRISTLIAINWQVGRTGVITPRAEIEPVFVGGTTVTFATLHNPGDIERKGFMLGDKVTVVRAGEVIPKLVAPVVNLRTGAEQAIVAPAVCPQCGSDIDRSSARWRCVRGRTCGLVASLRYAAARDSWDIDGLGTKIVEQLVNAELVSDVADLFTLTRADLLTLDRMGTLVADKLLAQIDKAKSAPLARTITALGIKGTGRSISRRLAKHFGTMEAFRTATATQLEVVDGIGAEKSPVLLEELADLSDVIDRLIASGMNMVEPTIAPVAPSGSTSTSVATGKDWTLWPKDLPLAGRTVVVTGSMSGPLAALSRNEVKELIEKAGGKSSDSVSSKMTKEPFGLLVAGDKAGTKLTKAVALDVLVLSSRDFAELVVRYL